MSRDLRMKMLGGVAVMVSVVGASAMAQPRHVMSELVDAKWVQAPPMLPAGAHISVLSGDPTAKGPYVVRLKFPADYKIPAHSHPSDENVSVVSGELFMGIGTKLEKASGMALGVGAYAMMPANVNHYAYTKRETIILLFGTGPVDFKYVDPTDDPRSRD
jgi:quercetin dioxygenase-like cupin family protein